jgi:hypothetical protein
VAAALAVTRVATLRTPVVADAALLDSFGGLASLARYLDAPVIVR